MWPNDCCQLLIGLFLSYYILKKKKENQFLHITCLWHWDWHLSSQARGMTLIFTDSSNIFAGALNLTCIFVKLSVYYNRPYCILM